MKVNKSRGYDMQPITLYNYSQHQNLNKKVSFTGTEKALAAVDNILSPRSIKLVKRAGELVENTWTEIRKGRSVLNSPEFLINDRNNNYKVFLKPLYNTARDTLLLEVKGAKYIDRIIVDRKDPNIFKYEKVLITGNGSATIKSYNSRLAKDNDVIAKVNENIEKYLPKFLPKESLKKSLL